VDTVGSTVRGASLIKQTITEGSEVLRIGSPWRCCVAKRNLVVANELPELSLVGVRQFGLRLAIFAEMRRIGVGEVFMTQSQFPSVSLSSLPFGSTHFRSTNLPVLPGSLCLSVGFNQNS